MYSAHPAPARTAACKLTTDYRDRLLAGKYSETGTWEVADTLARVPVHVTPCRLVVIRTSETRTSVVERSQSL